MAPPGEVSSEIFTRCASRQPPKGLAAKAVCGIWGRAWGFQQRNGNKHGDSTPGLVFALEFTFERAARAWLSGILADRGGIGGSLCVVHIALKRSRRLNFTRPITDYHLAQGGDKQKKCQSVRGKAGHY